MEKKEGENGDEISRRKAEENLLHELDEAESLAWYRRHLAQVKAHRKFGGSSKY